MKRIAASLLSTLLLVSSPALVNSQNVQNRKSELQTQRIIEQGKFRIYETKQLRGEESYEIRPTGSRQNSGVEITANINLPFMGEDEKPKLTATLRALADLTPRSFEIKGLRPLEIAIDTSINVEGKTATVREAGAAGSTVTVAENFFTFGGYLPVTMEMMLVRYWPRHGRKNSIALGFTP